MAKLTDLPDELLLSILEIFNGELPNNVFPVLLVNRQFYQVAEPLLYKTIHGDWPYGSTKPPALVRKLLTTPEKAAVVQDLTLDITAGEDSIIGWSADEKQLIQQILDRIVDDDQIDRVEWLNEKYDLCMDLDNENGLQTFPGMAILMITNLPKIRRLNLLDPQDEVLSDLWITMERLVLYAEKRGEPRPLQYLESLAITHTSTEKYPRPTAPLALATTWPSVRRLTATVVGDGDNSDDETPDSVFLELKPQSSDITSIRLLENSQLLGEHLVKLLGAPKALEEFTYEIGHAWSWISFEVTDVSRALDQQRDSLRELRLRLEYECLEDDQIPWDPMDFSKFGRLQKLDVAFEFIYGRKLVDESEWEKPSPSLAKEKIRLALPATLRDFSLVQCDTEAAVQAGAAAIEGILDLQEDRFPDLRSLRLECMRGRDLEDVCLAAAQSSRRIAAERGISFVVARAYYNDSAEELSDTEISPEAGLQDQPVSDSVEVSSA